MSIQDNKSFNLNISGRQLIGIVVTFALCAVAIYAEALTIGYIVVTLGLCAFFMAVGLDFGVNRASAAADEEPSPVEAVEPGTTPKGRSTRRARTA